MSLKEFIDKLRLQGELLEINDFVNTELEITEIVDRMSKLKFGGKALLFTNTGYEFPVLINHFGSEKRMLAALEINNFNEPAQRIDSILKKFSRVDNPSFIDKIVLLGELKKISSWLPKKLNRKGFCQEVIEMEPDLWKLPVLKCWPYDGGKFITLPLVVSEDPETGVNNIGMYRMQIYDSKTTGMHWHMHKGGALHFEKYKKLGKRMPVSVVLGGDPAITYCATAPMPENIDEYILAGFIKNKSVQLVKCITNDLYVPSDADFIIEGYIDPNEEFKIEGPFGDHTGFYSLADNYPVFHVTCITHRKDAVYPATIVGVPPMEDYYFGKLTERIFIKPIQFSIVPELLDMRLPSYGVAHNLVLLKADIRYPGQSFKIMNALMGAGQMMFTKVMCCFDSDVDLEDDVLIINYFVKTENLLSRIMFNVGPSDVLDHASYISAFGGKLLFDFTGIKIDKTKLLYQNDILEKEGGNIVSFGKMSIAKVDHCGFKAKEYFASRKENFKDSNIIIFIDNIKIDFSKPYIIFWYLLNNFDPLHDCFLIEDKIVIDCRGKHFLRDGFSRYWPNVVCMSDEIIESVDQRWCKLTGMDFVPSPSKSLKPFVKGEWAVVSFSEK